MSKDFWEKNITLRFFNKRFKIKRKMFSFFFVVFIIPITASIIMYSSYSASTMENEILRNMQVTVAQAKNNVNYRMEQVEDSSMSILTTIYPYLSSEDSIEDQLGEYYEMTRLFAEYQGHHMISKLRLYAPSSKLYSAQGDTFFSLDDLPNYMDSQNSRMRSGTYWLETRDITLTFGEKPISAMSCVKALSSISDYEDIIGVLFADIDVSQFNTMLSSGISENESLFIVNASGTVLAHSNPSYINTNLFSEIADAHFNKNSGSQTLKLNGEDTLTVYSKLDAQDWYLVMTVPRSSVFSYSFFSLDMVRLIIIFVIIAAFVAAIVLTYHFVVEKTVLRINRVINTLETEGITPLAEQQNNEIINMKNKPASLASLEQNANQMALVINTLLKNQYRNEIAVRDYQMSALQAQINPHFLYNTLDVIKWMIIDGNTDSSVFMVNALSRYFQKSLNKGKDIVRIEEEVDLTKTYLAIMQKRFENRFTVKYSIEREVMDCMIPKLSLQPLVENALLHGILYTEKPNPTLSIRMTLDDDCIIIDIEDNGDGMDTETLAKLRELRKPGKSYGLANVRERLELFGTDPSGFEIFSKKGIGTCINIRLPIRFDS